MFTALALAAVIASTPTPAPVVVTNPYACPSATWAEPAGEAGYVCSATDPAQHQVTAPKPPTPSATHHHGRHHHPRHHRGHHAR